MPLTLTIPDEILEAFPDTGVAPDRRVLESVVLELYREEVISGGRVAELLGLSRIESDRLLADHNLLRSPSSRRYESDRGTLEQMLGR